MSKSVRWGKPSVVLAGLNQNSLKASAHHIRATILDEIDGHVKFREEFPDLIGWINYRICSKIYS